MFTHDTRCTREAPKGRLRRAGRARYDAGHRGMGALPERYCGRKVFQHNELREEAPSDRREDQILREGTKGRATAQRGETTREVKEGLWGRLEMAGRSLRSRPLTNFD